MSRYLLLALLVLALGACEHIGQSEVGLRFSALPPYLGGGLHRTVIGHGETTYILPWQTIYRFDTREHFIEWGPKRTPEGADDFLQTRSLDGNEVSLAVEVRYSISEDPERLVYLLEHIGTSNEAIEAIVSAAARADIRTQMNYLKTSEFFKIDSGADLTKGEPTRTKYHGEQESKRALESRLGKYGILVQSVNLKEHRFERVLQEGNFDRRYQEKINAVQTREQETEREELAIKTMLRDKDREEEIARAEVESELAQVLEYKKQVIARADAYFNVKKRESEALLFAGTAEVEGLAEKIQALAGPGGEAILKMELVQQLIKNDPHFVLIGSSDKGGSLDVNHLDTNDVLRQLGVLQLSTGSPSTAPTASSAAVRLEAGKLDVGRLEPAAVVTENKESNHETPK